MFPQGQGPHSHDLAQLAFEFALKRIELALEFELKRMKEKAVELPAAWALFARLRRQLRSMPGNRAQSQPGDAMFLGPAKPVIQLMAQCLVASAESAKEL